MRLIRSAVPFLFAGMLLSGCGGHGGGSKSSSGGSTFVPSNSYTLRSNVLELDKTATVVTSVTSDTVVLTGAPVLTPGQILIHNATDDTRFLRKVVTSAVSGTTTTVTTTDAAATDVFEKANIAQDSYASAADLLKLQPAQDGVTFTAIEGKGQSRDDIPKINLNFANFQVKDDSGKVIADVSGTVSLGAGLQTIWRQSNSLSLPYEAGVSGIAQVSGTLTAHARASGTFSKEVPVSFTLPIPISPLGPLGVNLNLQMLMKVDGTYTADGQFVATATATATAGVHYDTSTHWQFSHGFPNKFTLTPPSLHGSIEFGVSLIRPSISADILGLGEAHVKADAMKAIAKIDAQTSPAGFLVQGYGDFGFTVGGSLHIGPWTLWSAERDYDIGRFTIVQPFLLKTLGATESQIVYVEPTHTKLHAMNGDGTGDRVLYVPPVAAFSPDVCNATKKICFISYDKRSYAALLSVITADGKTLTTVPIGNLLANNPTWNPSGTEIAFDAGDPNGVTQINVVNLASGKIRKLTDGTSGLDSSEPVWSSDGTTIYYQHHQNGVVYVLATSSASPTLGVVLANDSRNYTDPSASPLGGLIVAKRSDAGLVVCDAQGRNEHTIVPSTAYSHPRWSPDGTRIVASKDDTNQIVSFDLNGLDRKVLASGTSPAWGYH